METVDEPIAQLVLIDFGFLPSAHCTSFR
jgi:hypothetical protein